MAAGGGRLALIGCGGVSSGADVLAKLRAGAQLVQLYAAFAVHGPALLPRIKAELAAALRREGFAAWPKRWGRPHDAVSRAWRAGRAL